MRPQPFKSFSGELHKEWLSRQLGIPAQRDGIDLENEKYAIEVKSRLRQSGPYPSHFTVAEYQIEWTKPDKDCYWAFISYKMSKKVSEIKKTDNIEESIAWREAVLKEWDFVRKFPVAKVRTGPFRYVRLTPSDRTTNIINMSRGIIYLPEDFKI